MNRQFGQYRLQNRIRDAVTYNLHYTLRAGDTMSSMESPEKQRIYDDPIRGSIGILACSSLLIYAASVPNLAELSLAPLSLFVSWPALIAFLIVCVIGCFIGYRIVGLIPFALTVIALALLLELGMSLPDWLWQVVATAAAVAVAAATIHVLRGLLRELRHRRWESQTPRRDLWICAGILGLGSLLAFLRASSVIAWTPDVATGVRLLIVLLMTGYAWHHLFRIFFELCVEMLIRSIYWLRFRGPGLETIPHHGPVIVIANHACWWDPLFLAGGVPRPITPMMTSAFYDIWFLRPLMVYIFHVIRVREVAVRKEMPEIDEAIQVLDAGECLVIFPEGYLRRKEEQPLRRFGRGIWEILRARPETPVVACWIEGGWGSWTSFFNGPPLQNKKPDFWRPVTVSFSSPHVVPAEVLKHHLATRLYLMNEVAAARKHQGLPELPRYDLPASGEE